MSKWIFPAQKSSTCVPWLTTQSKEGTSFWTRLSTVSSSRSPALTSCQQTRSYCLSMGWPSHLDTDGGCHCLIVLRDHRTVFAPHLTLSPTNNGCPGTLPHRVPVTHKDYGSQKLCGNQPSPWNSWGPDNADRVPAAIISQFRVFVFFYSKTHQMFCFLLEVMSSSCFFSLGGLEKG